MWWDHSCLPCEPCKHRPPGLWGPQRELDTRVDKCPQNRWRRPHWSLPSTSIQPPALLGNRGGTRGWSSNSTPCCRCGLKKTGKKKKNKATNGVAQLRSPLSDPPCSAARKPCAPADIHFDGKMKQSRSHAWFGLSGCGSNLSAHSLGHRLPSGHNSCSPSCLGQQPGGPL